MATATITITDESDGNVRVQLHFDPEVELNSRGTPAQRLAMLGMDAIAKRGEADDDAEDEEG